MRNNNNKKEVAIFRIAVLAVILMLAFEIAMNGIIIGIVAAVVSGVFLLYFLVHDRRHFR
ncbi:hypothetical protein GC425_08990 [Corynebacterium sp. zg254]|uniref:Secreted protein n=1 Tax=Corynebacterium zhongnanshanii TaxID=2768834 RepID=A0ABQ6VFB6_9CORY|nr:hypothetical protein F8377_09025 [Corynebacterium zhongnanshanii]MCR5914980.1 hypothetical protein [Corynebacterium sp. zg254]